jgi:hypothetical protein
MSMLGKKSVETSLVGATLVAAFHDSRPPLVWRFDLERNHSFVLALEGDEGDCELGVTSQKGEFYPIARFAARADALEALVAVQKRLMKRKGCFRRMLFGLFLCLVAMAAGAGGASYYLLHNGSPFTFRLPSLATPLRPDDVPMRLNELPNGVPLPADRVLRPPP